MLGKRKIKIIASLIIIIMILAIFIGKIYSDSDNHYVLDVVKDSALNKDDNMKITESIVKNQNEEYFDSKKLTYQVDLENIKETNVETQVAMVIDSSYSMEYNDTNNVVKNKAIEMAKGILDNVTDSKISISNNNNVKNAMTNNITSITNQINNLVYGEGSDSNIGLENAYSTFTNVSNSKNILKKYIIVFTDSTDDVEIKMKNLKASDPDLQIINILVDMTSTSYINNGEPVCGEVYLVPSEITEENVSNNIKILDLQKIYDELNRAVNNITLTNIFSDEILTYFDITDFSVNKGNITKTNNGYTWNIDQIKSSDKATMTYTITLKTDMDIDSGIIFNELYTNKEQNITYQTFDENNMKTLQGTDSRQGTESTLIKICQGYDIKIKAVNESNKDLVVSGIEFKVQGTNENGEVVCELTKTTDTDGYITITADEERALRADGKITYTVTPNVNLVGYSSTDTVAFDIISNKTTRKLTYDNHQSNLEGVVNEQKRLIEITLPINSQRIDFELRTEELNNNNVTISGCEYELIQPKLNNKYEMDVLSGKTNEEGVLHFNPTVMTKDGTYNYILRQISAPNSYDITAITLIEITYKDGKVTNISKQFNPNVEVKVCEDKENHVLITVGNECVEKNPFDLQINLSDSIDGKKLEGVTYLVTTTNANNQVRSEYVVTDSNGQINTQVYGDGNLNIKITEQSPKVGYKADTIIKELNTNRSNNEITIWNSTVGLNVQQNSEHSNIIVNLTSVKKEEQNIVRVSLVDSEETDVTVGKDVSYYLTDSETGEKYGPSVSDKNGELSFTIGTKTQGEHVYKLEVDTNTIPSEYDETKIEKNMKINIAFDGMGYIIDENVIDNNTVIDEHYSKVNGDGTIEYTCFIKIGYELIEDNTCEFKVQLSDKDETTKPIEGAKYNIDIEWDVNGITKTKVIKERQTNASGLITTRVVKGSQVRIYVTEVGASAGYACDTTTQEIYLTFNNNGQINIVQSPYDRGQTNTDEPKQGAYVNGSTVVYQHLNRKRSTEDTYLNLTVNKIDPNGAYVDGVILGFESKKLIGDKETKLQDIIMKTGEQGSTGTVTFDYEQYIQNIRNDASKWHTIRVPGIGDSADEIVYDLNISEMKADKESDTGYSIKDGTTVKLRLIFRNKDNRVTLTNVETIYGNRLVKTKEFSSSSDNEKGQQKEDALGVYLSNITLDLYTNYDDVGNLSLDFKKQDNNEKELVGAEYDIKVVNLDGTVIRKHIQVDNRDVSESIELTGISVNVGSLIYLTETKAPIGYEINSNVETLEVKGISDEGEITLQQIDQAYSTNRLKLQQLASTHTTSDTIKTNYEVTLTDYSLDTFEFGIQTVDSSTLKGIGGNGFKVESTLGAQKNINTDSEGKGNAKIGGNIENQTVTYTINHIKTAEYYKTIKTPINVNVVFDLSGNVDIDKTMLAQTDSNYGTLWTIEKVETTGKIEVKLLLTHREPLVVKVETLDKITNNIISEVNYKITESNVLPATGSNNIEVGYSLENGVKTYKLAQTSIKDSYAGIKDKTFTITYSNEKIANATLESDVEQDIISITGDKEIKITVYAEPKTPIEINNLYYFNNNTALQGANFEVTEQTSQETNTGTTDSNGVTGIYAGILGTKEDKTYKIRQTLGAAGYATIDDFYIKVSYNENREITATELVDQNGTTVTNNRFVSVSFTKTSTYSTYNGNNKGIVKIQVLNYPEFKMNIENVDRRNDTKIVGTEYNVSSTYLASDNSQVDFTSTNGVKTNANGIGIAHLDKTRDNAVVTYTVKEIAPATGYQSLGTDIRVIVTFDENGYVSSAKVDNENNLNNIEHVDVINPIVNPEDNFEINLQLKNNPILKFNLTTEDSVDHNTKIKDIGLQIISKYNDEVYSNSSATNRVNKTEKPETSYTDVNGYTAAYMDRTLDNKDMYYTIKEVQKSAGYEWTDNDIIIKVSYDSNGKISSITPTQGGAQINITSYNANDFEINIEIYNKEIKEFGVHLSATDTYDKDKKINDMKVEAFLSEGNNYNPDGKYELIGNNALISGADRDNNGTPDLSYGEDYKTIGKYVEGAGTRALRLIIKNDSHQTKQSGYYLDSTDGTASGNNIGYYRGSKYYNDAKYQTVEYQYLINVTFDDEGKITDAQIQTGLNSNIGWLTDSRYLEVDHTNYKLNINMKFFPVLDLKLSAMDNYTYQNEISNSEQPIALNGAKYTVTTQRHNTGAPAEKDEFVRAGYIGYGNYYGNNGQKIDGSIYEDIDELFVPIENNHTRKFYVFEESEPTNYQKYTDRYLTQYEQKLVAIISVTFNEYGEIDYQNSVTRKANDTTIEPYMDESGSNYLSSNNLKKYNYYYNKTESNRNMNFYIGYALTTKLTVKAVDDISTNPICNIKMYPFENDAYTSKTPYEYNVSETGYRYTSSKGTSSWTYWGAAQNDNINTYIVGSSRAGNDYNGYLFPSDMASKVLGGSENPNDYYAKLDITYDSNGKISNVQSLGADLWGDNNVENITWDSETGNIYINMLYSRKFQTTLNKTDYYDGTINNLTASFDVISNKGLNTSINSKEMTSVGKIYKDATVKYTLSEKQVPEGYYPISNTIDYFVTFDENGNISKNRIKSNSEYFETVNTTDKTEEINKTSPDLTINIKNKPAFNLAIQVIDQFYKNDGLSDVYLKVTNNKGDLASGNPQTDSRGYANIIAGPVYPDETVTYYIEQTNTVDGYYQNATKIELQVKYNTAGKVEDYKITNGNDIINKFNGSKYMNTRTISMQIMNMPKELNIGLYKYDQTTDKPMEGVSFTITKTDINSGVSSEENIITETNGAVIKAIDTFRTSLNGKNIKYTIHEDETPASYRTMEDITFLIRYNADGSMASCNQIANDNGVINTKATLDMATNGVIKYLNKKRVHFNVKVSNDNAFDLIVKDEDTNYSGLGIEGSKFDISINGKEYSQKSTDENGKTTIENITDSGELEIKIAQRKAGEGYKFDVENTATIKLVKGIQVYSLDLDSTTAGYIDNKNATTTKAIITVDETYGKIYVTFKNETKTELTILKQDVKTKQALKDTEFEVIAQQIDNNGDNIGDSITLTTDDNKVTNDEGKIYFELGVAPQSQIWQYTFKEIRAPEGYNTIVDMTMTVTYDQYGRISKQVSSKASRLKTIMQDENYNCHSMYAIIYNGDVSPAYTVKVVTEDAETGKRINGSSVYLNITEADTGDLIKVEPKTSASAKNGEISKTNNLGIDGKMWNDSEVNSENSKAPIIVEKGLTYIDNIDYEGTINIEVSQKETAAGYIFGNQHTDGNVKISSTYVPQLDGDPTVEFTMVENDGFNVIVDDTNRTITIKILNESQVMFNIKDIVYGTTEAKPIQGVNYNITSEIQTATDSIVTDLNETTPLTDSEGKTNGNVGKAYAGKTIVYTLHQNISQEYMNIDDIQIEVKYDSKGYIKYYELLSSENNVSINEKETSGRTISLTVQNRKQLNGYTVFVEKHAMDTDDDKTTYSKLLSEAKYKITVHQEDSGVEYTTWTDTTNDDGLIEGLTFNGFGYITITLEELTAPDGYQIDTIRKIRLYRNSENGEIEEVSGDLNFDHDENYTKVTLKPIDKQANNKYTLIVNKISTATGKYITDNQAEFKATLQKQDEEGNISYQDTIDNIYTNKQGKAIIDNLDLPVEDGEYKLILTEIKAPEGYKILNEPIELIVNMEKDSHDQVIISSVSEEYENISTSKVTKQLIGINVGNDVDEQIQDDEYSLDITKIDAEKNEPIENMAIFKVWLPDENNTAVYTETSETLLGPGKLDYCYIEQDKDYKVRLTHMKKPTQPGTYKYTFKEVLAPEGYAKIEKDIELTIEFALDQGTNELYIINATSSDEKYLRVNTQTPCATDTKLSIDILNYLSEQTKFTVHYDANDNSEGTNVPADQIKEKDVDLILDSMNPIRDGYVFKGWATLPNSASEQFNPGGVYNLNQDITLYAVWAKGRFTIHYDANDNGEGTKVPEDQTKNINIDMTLNETEPSRNGYIFKGWTKDQTSTTEEYKAGAIFTEDKDTTLYAIWEEKLYLKSTEYVIGEAPSNYKKGDETEYKDGDEYISRILPYVSRYHSERTTSQMIKDNIISNADNIEIYKEENKISDTDIIGTNMTLKLTKGSQNISIKVIVTGDTNGDGKLTAADISALTNHRLGKLKLEGAYLIAADTNYDGTLTAADKSKLTNIRLNILKDF